ncbi:MAG: heme o synthase [Chloroflexota bacterium]
MSNFSPDANLDIFSANNIHSLRTALSSLLKTIAQLFKLRIVFLLLLSAFGGAILGAGGWPDGGSLFLLLVSGFLSASGASAINQYLEREIDKRMERTKKRPLPAGLIHRPTWIVFVGVSMVVTAVGLAWLYNPTLAITTGLGAFVYVGIYTLWLKPRTIVNIVIGGAAGCLAVLSGGAAVGEWAEPGVVTLALLVFLWTPAHFWSLAIAYRDDYASASFPMLPAVVPQKQAAGWVMLHILATVFAALVLGVHPSLGMWYLVPIGIASFRIIQLSVQLLIAQDRKRAMAVFHMSNAYLGLVLLFITLNSIVN